MRVRLLARDGGLVHEAVIPEFRPAPEVITWGSRTFVLAPGGGESAQKYYEGLSYPLIDGVTTTEHHGTPRRRRTDTEK